MTELVLAFEEYPDDEIRVRLTPVSITTYFDIADAYGSGTWQGRDEVKAMYAAFAPVLLSWTFEPPATADGLAEIDSKLSFAIVDQWLREVRKVPAPLPLRSSDTTPSEDPDPESSTEPSGSATS